MIKLIPLSVRHINYIMGWINDPEVTQYFAGMQKMITRDEELSFVRKLIRSKNDKAYSVFDNEEYVGQVAINQIHWLSGEGRLFLVVVKKHQNEGYGHQIIEAIQEIAFQNLKLHRLYLIVRPDNERGLQLYHRCGFRQEGRLFEKYKIGERWTDMIQMVILEGWWRTWHHR